MTSADLIEVDALLKESWDRWKMPVQDLWISKRQLKLLRRALRGVWDREVARGYPFHPLVLESL